MVILGYVHEPDTIRLIVQYTVQGPKLQHYFFF